MPAAMAAASQDMDVDGSKNMEIDAEIDAEVDTYIIRDGADVDMSAAPADAAESTPTSSTASVTAENCASYEIKPMASAVHFSSINCLAATQDFKWLFTGSDDGFIRKFDFYATVGGETMLTNTQRHGLIDSIQKAGVLISAWENESKHSDIKPVESSSLQSELLDNKISPVFSIDVHSKGVWCVTGLENGRINLWTVRHDEGTCVHVFEAHNGPVSVLKISPNERSLISGSWDRTVKLWNLDTGHMMREFKGPTSQITSIIYQPITASQTKPTEYSQPGGDASPMLATSIDGKMFLYDYREPSGLIKKFPGTFGTAPPWALSASWSVDGNKIYCGRRNNTVDEIDVRMGTLLRSLKLPNNSGPVSFVQCMPNGRHLLCASLDNTRLWDLYHETEAQLSTAANPESTASTQRDRRTRQTSYGESFMADSTTGANSRLRDLDNQDRAINSSIVDQQSVHDVSQTASPSLNAVDGTAFDGADSRFVSAFDDNAFAEQDPFMIAAQSPAPERTEKKPSKKQSKSSTLNNDADSSLQVPFTIIAGHHGGVISSVILNETGKYMVAASGTRGWDGISTNTCFIYDVVPIEQSERPKSGSSL